MESIWVAIHQRPRMTRILATQGAHNTLLKATLRSPPKHEKALCTLLEALAMWEGRPVRAALAVDELDALSGMNIGRYLGDDSGRSPLYTIDVVGAQRRNRHHDLLRAMGDFRDLRRLLMQEVAR